MAMQDDDSTPIIGESAAETLSKELERVKTAYGKLLEEHEQLQQMLGNEKAVVLEKESLSAELTRVKEENAQLLREKNQLEEMLSQGGDAVSEELTAELSRVKYAYAQQLQEHTKLKEAMEQAKAEIASLRGALQQRDSEYEDLASQMRTAEPYEAEDAEPEEEAEDVYLQMALDPRMLDNAGKIRFLNVLTKMDGSVKLSGSTNIRLSELAMLENGVVIPNPYFYRRFGADGELGSDIKKMRHVMQFAEPDSLRRYRLAALRPAVAEEKDGAFRLVQPGELMLS